MIETFDLRITYTGTVRGLTDFETKFDVFQTFFDKKFAVLFAEKVKNIYSSNIS